MKKIFFSLLTLVVALSLQSCKKDYTASIPPQFDAYCQEALDTWHVPGMAVVVVKDGETVFLKGYGYSNLESKTPVDPVNTQFVIASTSKAFTGALLATVIDSVDSLDWNDPVVKHLPDFRLYDDWATKNIMVKEVMTHHFGFKTYALDDLPMFGYDRDDLYDLFSVIQPTYSFRSKYAYNNESYTIAAKIIEKYTGEKWEDAIEHRIFEPLEMVHSTTGNKSFWTAENLATPYNVRIAKGTVDSLVACERTDRDAAFTWNSAVAPAAFVMTTGADMANWLKMHLADGQFNGKQVISPENHLMLFTPQTTVSYSKDRWCDYAQGWTIECNDRCRLIRHTGLAFGYTAIVALVPSLNMGIAVLTNNGQTSDPQSALVRALVDMYLGVDGPDWTADYYAEWLADNAPEEDEDVEEEKEIAPALPYAAYVGEYFKEVFGPATVYEKDGELWFHIKSIDTKLVHIDGNTFRFEVPDTDWGHFDLTFFGEGTRIRSLTFDINDPIGEFAKVR